jgi:hypothetical protein
MQLTAEERSALESIGPLSAAAKLEACPGLGRTASVRGFTCGDIDRGKIEDWLGEKHRELVVRKATGGTASVFG